MAALTSPKAPTAPRGAQTLARIGRSRTPLGLAGVAGALTVWQVTSVTGLLPSSAFPTMTSVATELLHVPGAPGFWSALGDTISSWALGVVITCIIAIPAGLVIGSSRFVYDSSRSIIEFLKPIPPIALIPLGLLLWGPSLQMKLILIVLGSVWPLLTQVIYGVQDVDDVALKVTRVYHLNRTQTVYRVLLPSISPFVITGLRLSAAIALIVAIVTEMIGGVPGLGQAIVQAQTSNALAYMYALVIITGVLGLIVNALFGLLERRTLHWHPSRRTRGAS